MTTRNSNGSSRSYSSQQNPNDRGIAGRNPSVHRWPAQPGDHQGPTCASIPRVLPGESMLARLKAWSMLARRVPAEEERAVAAGRQAEAFLHQIIGTHLKHQGASLWGGRRVPLRHGRGTREIDFVVCSPKMIHLIELKNWSGELIDRGRVWQQVTRSHRRIEHSNLISDNLQKRDLLVGYLQDNGIAVDKTFVRRHICQKVIFMNPRLKLPRTISSHPDVITWKSLPGYLDRQEPRKSVERILCSVVDLCLKSEASEIVQEGMYGSMSGKRFKEIEAAISRLRTWDRLQLFGTKVLTGDLLKLTIGSTDFVRESLAMNKKVCLKWTRGKITGLLKAITGWSDLGRATFGRMKLPLSPSDTVKFHVVGERVPMICRLIDVDGITLG